MRTRGTAQKTSQRSCSPRGLRDEEGQRAAGRMPASRFPEPGPCAQVAAGRLSWGLWPRAVCVRTRGLSTMSRCGPVPAGRWAGSAGRQRKALGAAATLQRPGAGQGGKRTRRQRWRGRGWRWRFEGWTQQVLIRRCEVWAPGREGAHREQPVVGAGFWFWTRWESRKSPSADARSHVGPRPGCQGALRR